MNKRAARYIMAKASRTVLTKNCEVWDLLDGRRKGALIFIQ